MAESVGQSQPGLELVYRLLTALDVPCELSELQEAENRVGVTITPDSAVSWLRKVLTSAQIKDVALMRIPWQRFDPRRLPALLDRQGTWYVVNIDNSGALQLIDSGGSETKVSNAELDGCDILWARIAARRADTDAPSASGNLATQLVWKELFRDRGWLWKIVVATCLINLIGVSTSLYAMQVYDRVVPTLAYATLTTLVAGMLIVVVLDWLLKTIRARILDSLACAVDQRMSQQVFDHLLHVQLDAQPNSLGTLAAQVSRLDSVRQFFSSTVVFALVDLPFALLFLGFIAVIGGSVAWVYALLLPAALILGFVTQLRLRSLLREQLSRSNERQGLLVDTIRGAETIRANNAGWQFAREWQDITASINGFNIQQRAISSLSSVSTTSLSTLAYVSAVVVGVWQIEAGFLTMGGLIACSILGGRIIAPVAQSVQYLVQWQQVSQSLKMVHLVLALASERRPGQSLVMPDKDARTIGLEKVRFGYPETPVQQLNVDELSLNAGDRVLLAGPVGSGKSTLLKVLAGLYRPSEGRVRLGNADLWETDPLLVSNQIGYLPQVAHLFRGTLRSNLTLTGTASDDRLLQVSEQLGIDAVAAGSPLGMDLVISEGGEGLSGGQRQLVALGRVFINQPRIWLLDEPTAALDREMEERVWQTLAETLQPEDILVVSTHRPMMASRLINRVVIMQQGRVVRDGTPETVLPQLMQPGAKRSGARRGNIDVV